MIENTEKIENVCTTSFPTIEELKDEIKREKHKRKYNSALRSTVNLFIVIAAVSILVAMLVMPVLRIYGSSMSPSLNDSEIVLCLKTSNIQTGDIVAFYYNNKILVKRMIASAGDVVDIDSEGNVSVNGVLLKEDYVSEKALGECDIELPYQVPDGKIFCLGDHRSVSIDSRSTTVGCISEEQIVGKLIFRIWPIKNIEKIK